MLHTLENAVTIVTGASSGIGAAAAHELARRGARVVLAARRGEDLEIHAQAIRQAGGQALAVPMDITDMAQIRQLLAYTREAFGPIDILVNNAGINWRKSFTEYTEHEIVRLLQTNLLGVMMLTHEVLPEMQQRRSGSIVMIGSVASHVALEPYYAASKFGVRGFSLALRRQLIGSGVSVSLVTPGNIRTAMTSTLQERMPEPEIVAPIIANLATRPRREVIVPFNYHAIIWLDRLFPGIADFAYHWRHRGDKKQSNISTLKGNHASNDQRGRAPSY